MIRNIQLRHAGKYTCAVQTKVDSISIALDLVVRGPPGPPTSIHVEEISDITASLSWRPGPDNHSPITAYAIQARTPFSLGWQAVTTVPDVVAGHQLRATVTELSPWVEYEFRVLASNAIGTGEPSKPSKQARTKGTSPKVTPANVSGGGGSRSELVITWELRYWSRSEKEDMASVQRTVGNQTSTVIRGVKGSTAYYISVRAYNTAGTGPPSSTVNVTTKKPRKYLIKLSVINTRVILYLRSMVFFVVLLSAPSQPPAKVMWNTSDSKIIINWERVKALENESEVTGYKVLYKKNRHSHPNVMETNTTSVELALPTDEDYIIQIKPFGEGGDGSSSKQITIPRIPGQRRAS
ncbi:unnamed protein product [Tetraodon nigroviridis]|uniref:(spotted green pufferfish) hypothetical protein n=1 Tax=Tetraodon nigroviridis TaxID=99883 RepID=Q4SR25_TETNG|nr:unnamed protein product [Tetraodon nigroviridis]